MAVLGLAVACAPSARAATLTWGATGTGGTGNWDLTTGGWWNGTTGTWNNTTNASDTAVFAGTAGTVTLSTGITAGGLTFDTTGYTITGNTLTLANTSGTAAVTLNANAATISSILAGTNQLQKLGSGTLTLSSSNSYSGGTLVSAGRILLGNDASLGSGIVTLDGGVIERNANGGTITNAIAVNSGGGTIIAPTGNYTAFSGLLSGSGALSLQGWMTLSNAANTYSGTISLTSGYLRITTTGAMGSPAALNLGSAPLRFDGGASATVGNFSGTSDIFIVGAGNSRLTVSGTGAYGGTLTNYQGSLTLEKSGNGTLVLNRGSTTGVITGVVVSGGTLQLAGAGRAYNGSGYFGGAQPITVNTGGVLQVAADFNTNSSVITLDGGTLNFTAGTVADSNNYANSVTLKNGATISGNAPRLGYHENAVYTVSGSSASSITANLSLVYNSGNTGLTATFDVADVTSSAAADLTISGTIVNGIAGLPIVKSGTGTLSLTAVNTYTGGTRLNAGVLSFGNNSLGTSGNVTLNSGTLQWASGNTQDLSSRLVLVSGSTATLDTNGNNVTLATGFGGTTSALLVKVGSGTLTLSASNSWTGNTTISEGGLSLGSGGTSGSVAGNIVDNAKLVVNRSNAFTLSNVISGTGALVQAGAGALTLSASNSYSGGTTLNAGSLLLGNASALGTGTLTIGASLTVGSAAGSSTFTAANAVSISGASTLTLDATNGAFGFSGPITGSGVTLQTTGATVNAVTLSGSVNLGTGTLLSSGNNTLTIGAGAVVTADTIKMYNGTDANSVLRIDGGSITTKYFTIGNDSGGRGTVNQTSGTVTIAAGSYATRFGHWSNGANPGNQYNLTGGVFDATAVSANAAGDGKQTVNIGWDGQCTMTVGGGVGPATLKAYGIAIDTNGAGENFDSTLIVSTNGLVEVGGLGITSKDAGDKLVLNSGTVRATATGTWASVVSASAATLSALDAVSFAVTLSNDLTGSGTVNLLGSGGFTFNTTGTQTVAASVTGTAPITKSGTGITNVTGVLSTTGAATVSTGTLQYSGTGTIGTVSVNGGTLAVAGGRLNIGSGGIGVTSGAAQFSGGTIGATANWNSSAALALLQTTTFNTLDSTDSTTARTITLSGTLSGAGGLGKAGAGTLVLSAANTYTGTTTLGAGVVNLGAAETAGTSGPLGNSAAANPGSIVLAGGTLQYSTSNANDYSGRFSTAANQQYNVDTNGRNVTWASALASSGGALTKLGSGTLTLSGTNTYSGVTTITGGVLAVSTDANLGTAPGAATPGSIVIDGGALAITNGFTLSTNRGIALGPTSGGGAGTIDVASGQTATYGGVIADNAAGTGGLVKAGAGTLVLSAANTYTGTTTLGAGVVNLNAAETAGTSGPLGKSVAVNPGSIVLTGGTLQYSASNANDYSGRFSTAASQQYNVDTNGQNVTWAAALTSSGGSLTKLGSGTLTLAADNTYAGNTTISAGVIQIGSGGATGSVAGKIANSGTAIFNRSGALSIGGIISGSGALVQAGSGTTTLSGVNTYSGATTITGGVLAVSTDEGLGAAPGSATPGSIVVNGGGLAFTSGFTLTANRGIALGPTVGSGTGTIEVASGQTVIYGGVLANNGGTGSLVKAGAGTLQLSGSASYTGNTSVDAGTLQVGAGASLASPLVTVASGATLSGRGTVNAVTVASGGLLAPGVASSGTLTTGTLTFSGAATVTMGVAGTAPSSLLNVLGDVTASGGAESVVFAFGNNLALINTGTYSLLTYSGTLNDTSAFNWSGTKGGRQDVSVSGTTLNGAVSLVIGNAFPLWTGTNGTGWFTAGNWELNTDLSPTNFQNNDTVEFNDVATSGTAVISGSNATPASVTFSGNTKAITLEATGGFGISTGAVVKSGSALVTITNANTYDGGTTLLAGRIRVGANSALGTGPVQVNGSSALSSDSGSARTLANGLHLDANLTLGDSTDTGALTFSGTVTFDGQSRTITTPSTVTLSGLVTNGGLTKSGTGVLAITGSNNYANGTTLSAGTLRVGNDAALGGGSITLNAGTLSSNDTNARTLANAFTIGGDVTLGDATNSGTLTLGSGGIGLGGGTRQVTTASDVTFAGAVTNGGLTKLGAGTLTLAVANSYGAGTTLSAGAIALGNVGALGSGTVTVSGNGTIRTALTGTIANAVSVDSAVTATFDATSGAATYAGAIGGSGAIAKSGAGTVVLSGTSTYGGDTTISAGTLEIGGAGLLGGGSYAGTIANSGTLAVTTSANQTLSGLVSGVGSLTKSGAGTLTLSNASNSFSGGSAISGGTVAFSSGALGSSGAVTVSNAALRWATGNTQDISARLALVNSTTATLDVNGNDVSLASGFGDSTSAALVKIGSGKLSIAGTATYTGDTTISAGTFEIGGAGQLGGGSYAGAISNAGTFTVASSANQTLSGVISGTGVVSKSGAGTLTLSNASSTYSGQLTIAQGTVSVATVNNVSANGPLGKSASAVILGSNGNLGTLAYTSAGATTTKPFTLATGGTGGFDVTTSSTLTVSGVINGSGILSKSGAGVLVISASNTYSTGAVVNAGTLRLGSGFAIPANTSITVAAGATFDYNGASPGDATRNYSFTISGSGANGLGAITDSAAAYLYSYSNIGSLTLAADAAIGGNGGRFDVGNGAAGPSVNGGGFTLTKVGSDDVSFRPETITNLPAIRIAGGKLWYEAFSRTGTATASMANTILSGATLSSYGNLTLNMPLVFEGGTLSNDNDSSTWTGPMTVNSATSTVNAGLAITLSGSMGGSATLRKTGGSTLTIGGDLSGFTGTFDSQAGTTVLSGGTAGLGAGSQLRVSGGTVTFSSGRLGSGTAVMNGGTLQWATGNTDGAVNIGLVNGATATLDTNGNNVNLANGLGGGTTANVTKSGGGTLTLSGPVSYSGATTVSTGTLQFSGSGTVGSVGLGGSAGLVVATGANITTGVLNSSNTGATLNIQSGATLTSSAFSNGWQFAGITSNGTWNITGNMLLSILNTTTIAGSGTVNAGTLTNANSTTANFTVARLNIGSGGITNGSSNGTAINFNGSVVGASANWSSGVALTLQQTTTFDTLDSANGTTPRTIALSGALSGAGGLAKVGSGTLALSANNTYAGATTVSAGVLALSGAGNIASSSGVDLSAAGATLDISTAAGDRAIGSLAGAAGSSVVLGSNGLTAGDGSSTTFAGVISGGGGFTKAGGGTLTFSGSNTYSGTTAINQGTLALSGSGSLAPTSNVELAFGAGFDISAANGNRTIGYLLGAPTSSVGLGANTLTVDDGGSSVWFEGVMSGSGGGLTKAGAGTLTLSNPQTFTGTARVEAGTLAINLANTLTSASKIHVASGATLDATAAGLDVVSSQTLGGYGTVIGTLALESGAVLSPGGSVGTFYDSGTTTWYGGMNYLFEINNASGTAGIDPGWDLFSTTGDLLLSITGSDQIYVNLTSLSGTSSGLADNFNQNYNYTWKFATAGTTIGYTYAVNPTWFQVISGSFQNTNNGSFFVARGDEITGLNPFATSNELYVVYAAIPEPGTLALAGIGLAAVGWTAYRRRRRTR